MKTKRTDFKSLFNYSRFVVIFFFISSPHRFDLSGKRLKQRMKKELRAREKEKKSLKIANNNKIRLKLKIKLSDFSFLFYTSLFSIFWMDAVDRNQGRQKKEMVGVVEIETITMKSSFWWDIGIRKPLRGIFSQQIWNIGVGEWFVKW